MLRRHTSSRVEQLEQRQLLAADVMISEIMYHPASDDVGLEYIELHNAGDVEADLRGWQFDTGIDLTIPAVPAATIPAGGYLVVAADVTEFAREYPDVSNVVGGWTGRLANRGESITLLDPSGDIVDRVRYADEGDWARRILGPVDNGHRGWRWLAEHDGDGKSLELVNPVLPNELGHNWRPSIPDGGTPGQANSVAATNVAPLVSDLRHSPVIPKSSDVVEITMSVADEQLSAVAATLYYRADGDPTFQSVTMSRSGEDFRATVPAFPDGTVVEFKVTVTDGAGATRNVPDFESDVANRTANRLYQVLDDAARTTSWSPQQQPVSHLVMTDVERRILADIGDGPFLEASSRAQMNVTFLRIDGNSEAVRYNVGVRNRGGASRVGPPNNYRINFRHDETFRGQTRLNLNSRFTHAQIIGSAIFRLAGIAATEGRPMQVRVNGGDLSEPDGPNMFGSYVELEVVDGSFVDKYFPADNRGNLYRVIEAGTDSGDLRFEGTDTDAYRDTYSKRTNEETDDWSDLIGLVSALNTSSDAEFAAEVNRVIDTEQWLRFIALDSLLGNQETGLNVGRGDNFWLYRGTEDTRFKLIPHDLDTILQIGRAGQPNRSIFTYTSTPGLSRLLTHEEFVPQYYRAFVELIEDVFNPETLFPLMDQLIGYVSEDELADMKQFVVDRIAGVQAQLPTEFNITNSLPIVDGYHRTTVPSAELVGVADALETQSVLVNGQPADWSPFTREWSVSITADGERRSLVDTGAEWRYLDDGSDLSATWRSATFDDSQWRVGSAPLGYGEDDLGTVVGFGGNPANKHITTWFRHEFNIENAAEILDLTMRMERDDGAIVYLNGTEIARSNMPPEGVDFQTVASSWIGGALEGQQLSFSVAPELLQDGNNVLAVEIHQVSAIDDDLRFDVSLEATVGSVAGGVPLNPGVNRLQVQAFDGPNGSGKLVQSGFLDVWYDGAIVTNNEQCNGPLPGRLADPIISAGTLTEDAVLGPCGPAYRVTGEVTVPEGVTLTVLPGTTVFFESDSGLLVDGGRLNAEGEEFQPIRFTKAPELDGSWNGIQFTNSRQDNRITHAILEHATTEAGLVGLLSSRLTIENTTLDHADFFRIFTVDSSLVVRDSVFTDMFDEGEAPATDNSSEHIKGSGILEGGRFLIEGNYFGRTSGHNDSVDFDGAQLPGPIPLFVDNVFAGSGDDALDLETDAVVRGNAFLNVRRDQFNTSTGDANAISAGDGRNYFVYGNTFHNVDHAVQVKDDAFLFFEHNTVDTVHLSPIYFDLDDRSPGRGAQVNASIFSNTPVTFGSPDQAQELIVDNSIVEDDALELGSGNFSAEPRFIDSETQDFRLAPGSPARGRAFGGVDIGSTAPDVLLLGVPTATTGRTSAEVVVGGPGIVDYRYRLDDGPFSEFQVISEPIVLSDLSDGSHTLTVQARDVAKEELLTTAATWNINNDRPNVFISEVLASNDSIVQFGETPDLIELRNDSDNEIDLSGMSISDDPTSPRKFRFAAGTTIGPGGFIVLLATDEPGRGTRLGFRLASDGEGVYVYDANGSLLDSVDFGIQLTDQSIARHGPQRDWRLSEPTFGADNIPVRTGAVDSVLINEWLAARGSRFADDFVELHNTDDVAVDIGGLYVTDDPIGRPTRHQIPSLSFIGPNGFTVLEADANPENGADKLPFGLSANGEMLGLFTEDFAVVDQVFVLSQTDDRSQGRTPDGSATIGYPVIPSPGKANPFLQTETSDLMAFTDVWAYEQSGQDLGASWRDADFDDSAWPRGAGVLAAVDDDFHTPVGTRLTAGPVTHYFRSEFTVGNEMIADGGFEFELQTLVDDGAVIYINDNELLRLGLRDGEVNFDTTASRGIGDASFEGPFSIPVEFLRAGTNSIAVEVHQVSRNSSDVVFGAAISASRTFSDPVAERAIEITNGIRISELMYNPPGSNEEAEYIELLNVSDAPINLRGLTIQGGVRATLGSQTIAPNEYVVLSPDADVFRRVYGDGIRVVGTYGGSLSNGGEELIVGLPAPYDTEFDGTVLRFSWDDAWHPSTDGDGFSLEIIDPTAPISQWNSRSGWQASADRGGSPGRSGQQVTGDFNNDNVVDILDVDLMSAAIASSSPSLDFDLNGDDQVDAMDQTFLVTEIVGTKPGDLNLDGAIDFADFLVLSTRFGREDAVWSDGDFDSSGQVDFADFLLLSTNFGTTND